MSAARAPGRPRSAAADSAILAAAIALFIEDGLEGASIEQIARRAGVTRATVYRRWPSKEALIAEALGRMREGQAEEIDWGAMSADGLIAHMLERAPVVLAQPDFSKLIARLVGASVANPEMIDAYQAVYLAPRRIAFTRAVAEMKKRGRVASHVDADALQDMLAGALIYRALVRPNPPKTRRAWRAYCRDLLVSLGLID